MTVTGETVLTQKSPYAIAMQLKCSRWAVGEQEMAGLQGLWRYRGVWLEWYGGSKWAVRSDGEMKNELWRVLGEARLRVADGDSWVESALNPSRNLVMDVLSALEAVAEWPYQGEMPKWVPGGEGLPESGYCIAFKNRVLDVKASAEKGEPVLVPMSPRFVTLVQMPFEWGDAECPTFDRVMDEWSCGDEVWVEARKRLYGYSLIGARPMAYWGLEYGKPRSGKGMMTNEVMDGLLRGEAMSLEPSKVLEKGALAGLETARLLVVSEADSATRVQGREIVGTVKRIVGRDEVPVKRLYQDYMRGVRPNAVPILQCNQVPELPDSNRGLVSKMVALPFDRSWVEGGDTGLARKVRDELPGIGRELAMACVRLVAEGKIEQCQRGKAVLRDFLSVNNPWQQMMEDCFVPREGGRVEWEKAKHVMRVWEQKTGITLKISNGMVASDRKLVGTAMQRSGWQLDKERRKAVVYVKGMVLRKEMRYED